MRKISFLALTLSILMGLGGTSWSQDKASAAQGATPFPVESQEAPAAEPAPKIFTAPGLKIEKQKPIYGQVFKGQSLSQSRREHQAEQLVEKGADKKKHKGTR